MPTLAITNFNIVVSVLGGWISLFGLVSYLCKENFYLSEARRSIPSPFSTSRPHPYLLSWRVVGPVLGFVDPRTGLLTLLQSFLSWQAWHSLLPLPILFAPWSTPGRRRTSMQ